MVSAATETAVSASISTPVLAVVRACAEMRTRATSRARFRLEVDRDVAERDLVGEGDELPRVLRGVDARDARHGEDVALLRAALDDERQRLGTHRDRACCYRSARRVRLGTDVHHAGAAFCVYVREFSHAYTICTRPYEVEDS